tara:strand:- start:2162 stop:2551 length:390 start_codon:yes stop_codon:yes gene_type:complete
LNPKSSKAKGRRLQNYVRDKLREVYIKLWTKAPKLEEDDIKSQTMGMSGEDIVLSPAAKKLIPYSFECKNKERLNIWQSIEQCEDNSNGSIPVVVIKRNRSKVYAIMEFDEWLEIASNYYRRENGATNK